MDENQLRALSEGLTEVAGFMVTSARGLMDEPSLYGPFRLVDATSRLVVTLEDCGAATPFLTRLRAAIEAGRESSMGTPEEFRSFLDGLVQLMVAEG